MTVYKKRNVALLLCFALFLSQCADSRQTHEAASAPIQLNPLTPSVDLSKFPSLPTTAPSTLATSQPYLSETHPLFNETRPESKPESKPESFPETMFSSIPESSSFKPLRSTRLSIYERLKGPHTW